MPETADRDVSNCRHRWLLETPNGNRMSKGICRQCSAVRSFPNAIEENAAVTRMIVPPRRPRAA
jgi:hypothetical protein